MADDPRPGFNAGTAVAEEALRACLAAVDRVIDQNDGHVAAGVDWNALRGAILRGSAALAAPKAEAWQDISTAPKDGTVVLLARDMDDFGFVRGFGHFDGEPGAFLSGWITQGFDPVTSNLGLAHPTLWQPLPPLPAPPAHQGATS